MSRSTSPGEFDLSQKWRYGCPNCESVRIYRNVNSDHHKSTTEHDFHCQLCNASFDEPLDRSTL